MLSCGWMALAEEIFMIAGLIRPVAWLKYTGVRLGQIAAFMKRLQVGCEINGSREHTP